MSDLISRSALLEVIEDDFCNDCLKCMGSCRLGDIREVVLNAPTVEAIAKEKLDEIVVKLECEKVRNLFVGGRSNGKAIQTGINYGIATAIEIVKGVMNERD